ncbi:hypothetical protein EVAR_28273_1 [Eumeta japonica]|uniref:Uncharacterized protein n=1 Tax=Eumeta variegata TaxID=151549 RepID=A0A4C1V5N5_EUMVA|nr:hypothetical protein EVAR_28273_1 [Eumeta japonica]
MASLRLAGAGRPPAAPRRRPAERRVLSSPDEWCPMSFSSLNDSYESTFYRSGHSRKKRGGVRPDQTRTDLLLKRIPRINKERRERQRDTDQKKIGKFSTNYGRAFAGADIYWRRGYFGSTSIHNGEVDDSAFRNKSRVVDFVGSEKLQYSQENIFRFYIVFSRDARARGSSEIRRSPSPMQGCDFSES